jgi:hypothetical protein
VCFVGYFWRYCLCKLSFLFLICFESFTKKIFRDSRGVCIGSILLLTLKKALGVSGGTFRDISQQPIWIETGSMATRRD